MVHRKRPYTDSDLDNAIDAVQSKQLNLTQASKKYGVPHSSLRVIMIKKLKKSQSKFYYCLILLEASKAN